MIDGDTFDDDTGHILEVDLQYHTHFYDLHNDYPLVPQRMLINGVEKLTPSLYDKSKYVLHHRILLQYISLGMKLSKIHCVVKFKQNHWLASYIDLNTTLRTNAKNDFEKDFFKLMNNSVFGKTMENIRNRVNVHLVESEDKAKILIGKPNFKNRTISSENLIAMQMAKTKLVFNKPTYIGMNITDISKTLMYDFHYNCIKSKYGDKAKLLMTDTDSLCYGIHTEDFYKGIFPDVLTKFDTSAYPQNHPSSIINGVNKKVIGMMKDECAGEIITEFVGLRAILYATMVGVDNSKEYKKCKGVKKLLSKRT